MKTRELSIGLGLVIFASSFICIASEVVTAGSQTQLAIGFESGWDSSWSANDYNSASGFDYWGISAYRSHSGTHSAYCAEVGTNSLNAIANNVNHYYDQDMNAWLEIPIGDISGWSSATLSFYAWYVTGSFSLADYLWVGNSSDGSNFYVQWTQPDVTSSGWQLISFNLATSTTSLAFAFISDPTVGLGPYEGVYIDDIVVTVTDSSAPASSVGALSQYQTSASFSVPYTASDSGGSGLAYVELYFKLGTSGTFTLYTTGANPSGHWTSSPIEFDSSTTGGDGTYQLYTISVDTIGNWEAAPSTPDATTTVDTVAPSTSIDISGTLGLDGWYKSAVTITLDSTDATSGVASTVYLVGLGGDWQTYSGSFSMSDEGVRDLFFCSVDNAGNQEYEQFVHVKIDTVAPTTTATLAGTPGDNGWYIGDSVSVDFWFAEYASYVTTTVYRIDNGTWQTHSPSSGSFAIDKEGSTVIDYYSADVAGNVESQESVSFKLDSTSPTLAITFPLADAKISKDSVVIEWSGADYVSGIDHYEIQVDGGSWVPMGTATSFDSKGLQNKWHSVTVRAVDGAGNTATSTVSFGVYTSIWSQNGPYQGIPLYALIAAIIVGAIVAVLLLRKRGGSPTVASVPKEEPTPQAP